jgi:hypothetical protein
MHDHALRLSLPCRDFQNKTYSSKQRFRISRCQWSADVVNVDFLGRPPWRGNSDCANPFSLPLSSQPGWNRGQPLRYWVASARRRSCTAFFFFLTAFESPLALARSCARSCFKFASKSSGTRDSEAFKLPSGRSGGREPSMLDLRFKGGEKLSVTHSESRHDSRESLPVPVAASGSLPVFEVLHFAPEAPEPVSARNPSHPTTRQPWHGHGKAHTLCGGKGATKRRVTEHDHGVTSHHALTSWLFCEGRGENLPLHFQKSGVAIFAIG